MKMAAGNLKMTLTRAANSVRNAVSSIETEFRGKSGFVGGRFQRISRPSQFGQVTSHQTGESNLK
jgi:hypothetical protein